MFPIPVIKFIKHHFIFVNFGQHIWTAGHHTVCLYPWREDRWVWIFGWELDWQRQSVQFCFPVITLNIGSCWNFTCAIQFQWGKLWFNHPKGDGITAFSLPITQGGCSLSGFKVETWNQPICPLDFSSLWASHGNRGFPKWWMSGMTGKQALPSSL